MLCGLSSGCDERQATLAVIGGLLVAVASLAAARTVGRMSFSSCGSWTLEHRLNICGAWSWVLHSMWYLLGSGIESLSAALAGGFFATEPPGKPLI